jgi:hypothetical protein
VCSSDLGQPGSHAAASGAAEGADGIDASS